MPAASWQTVAPEQVGWSPEELEKARVYVERIGSASVMVIVHGQVVASWGATDQKINVASIRKSLLSALYGIHTATGEVDVASTLKQLAIDDNPPALTESERQATVADLLTSRSGVYHVAEYETPDVARSRPSRGSHAPGTFYYYNNWDFNALGTIFERQTSTRIGDAFSRDIAQPLHMQDFQPADVRYVSTGASEHAAYPFLMSARDMARFGLLYLRGGRWGTTQVIPADWVMRSTALQVRGIQGLTQTSTSATDGLGYGYLWWVANDGRFLPCVTLPPDSFAALGNGGHYILVVPALDLVVVHQGAGQAPGPPGGKSIGGSQFGFLVRMLFTAAGLEQPTARALGC